MKPHTSNWYYSLWNWIYYDIINNPEQFLHNIGYYEQDKTKSLGETGAIRNGFILSFI